MSEYVHLYGTRRWRAIRAAQLSAHPLCVMCLNQNEITPATIADHVEPHRGNEQAFWTGKLQSLCANHHSKIKQQIELFGSHTSIGVDGFRIDPNHPVNKVRGG